MERTKKEQLAEQYAEGKSSSSVFKEAHKRDFLAGFTAAEPKWISLSEQHPPKDVELLVKSPRGVVHLASWRGSYNIFTCQGKNESSYDWQYMQIPQ
jgi:hypothetical protein